MSYLKLLWALSNGASTSGMVLATYRFSSHKNPPFASPNIASFSVAHSGCWHPLLPTMLPRNHHLIYHSLFHKVSHSKLQRNSRYSSKGEWSYLLKKREREREEEEKRKREAHSPFHVANYGVPINSNGMPSTSSTSYPLNTHVPWDLDLASTDLVLDHPSAKQYR